MKIIIIFAFALALAGASPSCKRKLKGRIFYGKVAKKGQLPYQVGISRTLKDGSWNWCGGSLINNQMVLTAAHCIHDTVKATIYLGTTDVASPGVTHKVTKANFIVHRQYNADTLVNDIALIKIPFTYYRTNIQPVKLPKISTKHQPTYEGLNGVVSGWGPSNPSHPKFETNLHWGCMHVITNEDCVKHFPIAARKYVKPIHLCASGTQSVSVCDGDSGGPLVLENSNLQIGLTTMGAKDACDKGYPAIFIRITKYVKWIRKYAGP